MSKRNMSREQEKAMFAKQNEGRRYRHRSTSESDIEQYDYVEITDPEDPSSTVIGEVLDSTKTANGSTYTVETDFGDVEVSQNEVLRKVPESEIWEPQEREFEVDENGLLHGYHATRGQEWLSGWDERFIDNATGGLPPGKYKARFEGQTLGGSDAIRNEKITSLDSKSTWVEKRRKRQQVFTNGELRKLKNQGIPPEEELWEHMTKKERRATLRENPQYADWFVRDGPTHHYYELNDKTKGEINRILNRKYNLKSSHEGAP